MNPKLSEAVQRAKNRYPEWCDEASKTFWSNAIDAVLEEVEPLLEDKWIRVDADMPPEQTEVFGYSKKWVDEDYNPEGVRTCFYNDGFWFSPVWNNSADEYINDGFNSKPTHWMPLPEPPKI